MDPANLPPANLDTTATTPTAPPPAKDPTPPPPPTAADRDLAPFEIVEYDPRWPALAAAAIEELRAALPEPGPLSAVEHIGSTAVPGLAAKPIIDLMAATADLTAVQAREDALTALGYRPHAVAMTDRLLYLRDTGDEGGGHRSYNLHVVTEASWPTRSQRLLRDYLRDHPEEAARYGELKKSLAGAGATAGPYTAGKTELIQELTDRARARLGLPPVPVWET